VPVASFQNFTIGVPVEKQVPSTAIRLVLPENLKYVTPNVKPGWNIEIKKHGEGESAKVTELIWSGGLIPAGQRDDFVFSAQVPPQTTTLQWKAYQTYQDGSVVAWEADPNSKSEDFSKVGPYSQTKIINDMTPGKTTEEKSNDINRRDNWIPYSALIIAALSLALQLRRSTK
jgi:uncharacterized protein YcnI